MSRLAPALLSAVLCLASSGCAGLAASLGEDPRDGDDGTSVGVERRDPEPTQPPLRVEDLLGSDGRLTVLILGSDRRDGIIGERTDAILVATIDPDTGRVAIVSLPRDTVRVPIAPGTAYADRINTLYWEHLRATGKKKAALRKTRDALAYAFGTEIDYYALLEFKGLVKLIDSIGGVDVTLKEALIDPTMHLTPKGLRLKAGEQHLDGKTALAFSRSRHSDSDYARSARQHQVIVAAADRVRERGLGALPALVEVARERVVTDIPMRAAPALLELAGRARLGKVKSIVLAPDRWARELPGTYTIAPRVVVVQKMFDRVFRPLG